MALKKWNKLPVNLRRSVADRWNELVDEVNSCSGILENAVDNDTIYDDTDIKSKMGYANIPENSNLQAEIEGKADSNHAHTVSDVSDLTTVAVVVTYEDETTETVNLVKQVVSNSP